MAMKGVVVSLKPIIGNDSETRFLATMFLLHPKNPELFAEYYTIKRCL